MRWFGFCRRAATPCWTCWPKVAAATGSRMPLLDWLILLLPLPLLFLISLATRRYIAGVADFLTGRRGAGRSRPILQHERNQQFRPSSVRRIVVRELPAHQLILPGGAEKKVCTKPHRQSQQAGRVFRQRGAE